MGLFDGVTGDMAGSLLGGKSGGVEQLPGGLLGNGAGQGGLSQTALLRMAGSVTSGSSAKLTQVMGMLQGR